MRSVLDDTHLLALLAEDAPYGDLTTNALGLDSASATMRFAARDAMVLCATEEAARLIALCGGHVSSCLPSATHVARGECLLEATGKADDILLAWKVAQNLVEWSSGIATAARRIVDALRAAGYEIPLACTRKMFPGTRRLAVKAVQAGGAIMHRLGLSESLLVFPEHRALMRQDCATEIARLAIAQPEKSVVIEVASLDDACAMAAAGAEILQLERFTPEMLTACKAHLRALGLSPRLAVAGGVTLENAVDFARAGADFLVSSAPYMAKPADVKVHIAELAS